MVDAQFKSWWICCSRRGTVCKKPKISETRPEPKIRGISGFGMDNPNPNVSQTRTRIFGILGVGSGSGFYRPKKFQKQFNFFFFSRVIVINQKIMVAAEEQMLTKKTWTETFLINFMMAKTKLHFWKDENQKLWLQWSGSYLILLYWVEIYMEDLWWLAIHLTTHQEQVLGDPCIQRWSSYASTS